MVLPLKEKKKKKVMTDRFGLSEVPSGSLLCGGAVFPVTSVSVFVSQRQEKTKHTLLLLHIHDPLRFAVRERLILRVGWFYASYYLESHYFI